MTISCIRSLLVIVVFFGFHELVAQESFTAYLQPQMALNYKVLPHYNHNLAISSRNYILRNREMEFQGRNLDISHFSTFSSGANTSFGLGLMYRFRKLFEPARENEFRLTQQLNITSRPLIVRYGHRLRSEQRIFPDLTIHRFRYRFTLDFPLQGEKVDVREAYLFLNTEALLSAAKGVSPQFDQ
ncbi:Protein of unknown function [Muriicola jejuensis]|uniref:DUF2490 domain-containing protein n=1 Tax=Muriicola jejuensis TaxID=504488 RepID=A0A6P0UGC2_9FLAO|nr:DUF2490 domain-containing protein [Muriicola jejuensis]NER10263.1 DUF2490 domain-containing protein [Muriicola jejuensis]SMP01653.1 Protein of unknown function [Muriicola jejuensis]